MRDAKHKLHVLAVWQSSTRRIRATFRWWFAGACIGVALTLALLNPLMCLLHCAFMDHNAPDAGLRAQQFHCAMLHHHDMPAFTNTIPDHTPSIGSAIQPPRALYEMSITINLIGMLLILMHISTLLAQQLHKYLGREPLAPPPKLLTS